MAKLTAADRNALPAAKFAGPNRSFPVPDANHAKAALGRINDAPEQYRPKIAAMARRVLRSAPKDNTPSGQTY